MVLKCIVLWLSMDVVMKLFSSSNWLCLSAALTSSNFLFILLSIASESIGCALEYPPGWPSYDFGSGWLSLSCGRMVWMCRSARYQCSAARTSAWTTCPTPPANHPMCLCCYAAATAAADAAVAECACASLAQLDAKNCETAYKE